MPDFKRTSKSGHSRSKPKCCLTFSTVDIPVILWEISRSLTSQTPQLAMSSHQKGINACGTKNWQEIPFMRRDGSTPRLLPADVSWLLLYSKPAFRQAWCLLPGDCKFLLPVFLKTLSRSKETLQKSLSLSPKRNAYKDTYSIKYIVFPVSDKVTQQV